MPETKKSHRDIYKDGDSLDACQLAEVLSENSCRHIDAGNVAAICKRRGIVIDHKFGGLNVYPYYLIKDIVVKDRPGRRPINPSGPLSPAEKQRRYRDRRAFSCAPGAQAQE